MTVDRALVLTGGWQTDRERAYVALSRSRDRSDVYVSREDLGEEGLDAGAIERLGQRMAVSRAQRPSIDLQATPARAYESTGSAAPHGGRESEVGRLLREQQPGVTREPLDVRGRESEAGRLLREQVERERDRAREHGLGIE